MMFLVWAAILAVALTCFLIHLLWAYLTYLVGGWMSGPPVEYDERTDRWVVVQRTTTHLKK